jgi:hypothetical protein
VSATVGFIMEDFEEAKGKEGLILEIVGLGARNDGFEMRPAIFSKITADCLKGFIKTAVLGPNDHLWWNHCDNLTSTKIAFCEYPLQTVDSLNADLRR